MTARPMLLRRLLLLAASVLGIGAVTTTVALGQRTAPARYRLVALRDQRQAAVIAALYGKQALWAWDPAAQSYRSTANYSPRAGATLYTPAVRAAALDSALGGISAAVRVVGASAGTTASGGRHRSADGGSTTTTSAPLPRSVSGRDTRIFTAPTDPPTSTTAAPPTTTGAPPPTTAAAPPPTTAAAPVSPASSAAGPWVLKFDDEFNGSSLDTSKWTPYWFSNGSTSNGTTMDSSNVSVSGGMLDLALNSGSGGLVSTNGKYQFTYGYAEARIYLPAGGSQGATWPAFWADGQSWPTDGEMDVMEGLSGQACFHFHSDAGGPGGCASGNFSGWHTYGADWEPGSVTYYYDGQKVGTITTGITSQPMYLILENSGGSFGGPALYPSTMQVDYVRVWQHS